MESGRPPQPWVKGRGAAVNPPNRFDPIAVEWDAEWLEAERRDGVTQPKVATRFFEDHSRSVLARNDSPDLGFDYSLNPYRGCEHGCAYCYARPSHEYLGFSAGLDFETRIMVKRDAASLLDKTFRSKSWTPQVVALSGNTDPYQPVERSLGITRACLEVFLRHGNPVEVVTKGAAVLRDVELLARLAERRLVSVTVSVTSLDDGLSRDLEPRAAAPQRRLDAIAGLAAAGVPVNVNVAPLIPALNDHEMPAILAAAAERGASHARYIMLRLPRGVEGLFLDWLREHRPDRADKVIHAIQDVRGGEMSDNQFGRRMKGEGVRAEATARLFALHCNRLGLSRERISLTTEYFRRGTPEQQSLF